MTKDVLLSIKGLQIGENEQNDTIEVISPGDYYFRNGKHFFMLSLIHISEPTRP